MGGASRNWDEDEYPNLIPPEDMYNRQFNNREPLEVGVEYGISGVSIPLGKYIDKPIGKIPYETRGSIDLTKKYPDIIKTQKDTSAVKIEEFKPEQKQEQSTPQQAVTPPQTQFNVQLPVQPSTPQTAVTNPLEQKKQELFNELFPKLLQGISGLKSQGLRTAYIGKAIELLDRALSGEAERGYKEMLTKAGVTHNWQYGALVNYDPVTGTWRALTPYQVSPDVLDKQNAAVKTQYEYAFKEKELITKQYEEIQKRILDSLFPKESGVRSKLDEDYLRSFSSAMALTPENLEQLDKNYLAKGFRIATAMDSIAEVTQDGNPTGRFYLTLLKEDEKGRVQKIAFKNIAFDIPEALKGNKK